MSALPHADGPSPWILWLLGPIALFLAAAWIAGRRREGTRRHALAGAAAQMGFSFDARARLPAELRRLSAFRRPRPRTVTNVIKGRRGGTEILCFDYARHAVPSGGEGHANARTATLSRTVAAFRTPGRGWPAFTLEPGGVLNRLPAWAAAAFRVVQLDAGTDFSRRYVLRSAEHDPTGVRGLFTPSAQNFFAASDAGREWSVEGGGEWLIVYRNDHLTEPAGFEAFVDQAVRVVGILGGTVPQAASR